MSCRFCLHDGKCDLWAEDAFYNIIEACDKEGHCMVDEDEN